MPIIREDEFLDLIDVINDPTIADAEKEPFKQYVLQYEKQQKDLGLTLTPKLEQEALTEQERVRSTIDGLYSGLDQIDVPKNIASLYTDEDSRAQYANTEYFKIRYGKDVTPQDYDLYRNDFYNKEFKGVEPPTSNVETYNQIKQIIDKDRAKERSVQENFKFAIRSIAEDQSAAQTIEKLRIQNDPNFNEQDFTTAYTKLYDVLKVYKPDMMNFASAMSRKMTGKSAENDQTTIDNFTKVLYDMPDAHRSLVLASLQNEAKRIGGENVNMRNMANEFADSVGRIFVTGYEGQNQSLVERAIMEVPSTGTVYTTVTGPIDSLQKAKEYVNQKTLQKISALAAQERSPTIYADVGPTETIPVGAVARELTPDESMYIKKALKDARVPIKIQREISAIGQTMDPVRDNWKGIIASTLGSSAALLGVGAVNRGFGLYAASQIYKGMDYNETMMQNPDMDPRAANALSTASGTFQAILDQATLNLFKATPKFYKAITSGGGSLGSRLLKGLGLGVGDYVAENVIEGAQDISRDVAQGMLSTLDESVPQVDWKTAIGNWWDTRPDVAIGMIPLTILGIGGSTLKQYISDRRVINMARDTELLMDDGITEADRLELTRLAEANDPDAIREIFPQMQARRDVALRDQRIAEKKASALIATNSAAALNEAIQSNAISNFEVNPDGTYTAFNNAGERINLPDREAVISYIDAQIESTIRAKQEIIAGTAKAETKATQQDVTLDDVDQQAASVARLKGADVTTVQQNNAAFGDKVQQSRLFNQMVQDLFSGKKKASQIVGDYVDAVYRNLPQSTRDALGADEQSGKAALSSIVQGTVVQPTATTRRSRMSVKGATFYNTLQQLTDRNQFTFFGIAPNKQFNWGTLIAKSKAYNDLLAKPDVTQQEIDDLLSTISEDKESVKTALKFASMLNKQQLDMIQTLQEDFDADYLEDQNRPPGEKRKFQGRPIVQIALPKSPQVGIPEQEADFAIAWLTSFKELFGTNIVLYNVIQENVMENGQPAVAPILTEGMYQAYADTIMVNVNGIGALPWTVGHEYMHRIRAHYPDVYDQIVNVIKNYVTPEQRNYYYDSMPLSYFTNRENSLIRSEAVKAVMEAESALAELDKNDAANADEVRRLQREIDNANKDIKFVDAEAAKVKKDYIGTREAQRPRKFTQTILGYSRVPKTFLGVFEKHPLSQKIVDAVEEEFYADFFASNFMDPKFWATAKNRLNPPIFERFVKSLVDYIKHLIFEVDVTKKTPGDIIMSIKQQVVENQANALDEMYRQINDIVDFGTLNLAQFPQPERVARPAAGFARYSKPALATLDKVQASTSTKIGAAPLPISSQQQRSFDDNIARPIQVAKGSAPQFVIGSLAYTAKRVASVAAQNYVAGYSKFIEQFGKTFGVNVLFFERLDTPSPNEPFYTSGFYDSTIRTIFVDANGPHLHQIILGHELGHHIQFKFRNIYNTLAKTILDILTQQNVDEYFRISKRLASSYYEVSTMPANIKVMARAIFEDYVRKKANNTFNPAVDNLITEQEFNFIKDRVDAEIANDAIGILTTNKNIWQDLAIKDPTLFDKAVQAFKSFVDALKSIYDIFRGNYANIPAFDTATGKKFLEEHFEVTISDVAYTTMQDQLVAAMQHVAATEALTPGAREVAGIPGAGMGALMPGTTPGANVSAMSRLRPTTSTSAEVNHVADKIRNTVALAQVTADRARARGEERTGAAAEEADVEATLAEMVSPIDEASFNAAVDQRTLAAITDFEFATSPSGLTAPVDATGYLEWLGGIMKLRNSLAKAQRNNDISLNALANAAAAQGGTYADVVNLTDVQKAEYIAKGLEAISAQYKEAQLKQFEGLPTALNYLATQLDATNPQGAMIARTIAEAIDMENAAEVTAKLFNELYTADGVPASKSTQEYAENLVKYNIIKTVANWRNMSADQLQQMSTELINIIQTQNIEGSDFVRQISNKVSSVKQEATTSKSLEKREQKMFDRMNSLRNPVLKGAKAVLQPLVDMLRSFTDSHLTFASLVELVLPNDQNATAKLYNEIADIQSKIDDPNVSEDEKEALQYDLSQKQKLIGKAITPEMQKVVDDLRNAYTQVLIDNENNEDTLRKTIAKIFNMTKLSAMAVNRKLFDLMDRTIAPGKGFVVKVNGKDYIFSQAYAGYILNLQETQLYNAQMAAEGFTPEVFADIRSKISKEANELRNELRKLIIKEHKTASEQSMKQFGIGSPVPPDNFFPVQRKSTPSSVVDSFDINFQGGITNQDAQDVQSRQGTEIELDLNNQTINMLSMFNSHIYLSTYQRNVKAPVTVAKAVLLDKTVRDKVNNAFGNDFYVQLYKLLNSIETNGVRTVEMSRAWRRYMRGFMGAVAKGALALNPTTILLNMTSFFNAALDASIPANKMMMSYVKALASITTLGNIGFGLKMTPKQVRQQQIIQQRIKSGANSLLTMSKTDPTIDKPGLISATGEMGLRPISFADGFMGSFAAAAAYDAHYKMAKQAGMTESDAVAAAEAGMKRTIQSTFQPNTVANKATVEISSNLITRMLLMFMGEARKAVGLEIASFKKGLNFTGGRSARNLLGFSDFARIVAVNHIIIGGLSFLIRAGVRDYLNDEEEDEEIWNPAQFAQSILVGPMSGLFLLGSAIEGVTTKLINFIIEASDMDLEGVKKLPTFPRDNMFVQTYGQVTSVLDIFDTDKDLTIDESIDRAINAGKAISAVLNWNGLAGATTIGKSAKAMVDFIDENIVDIMEEPEQ